MDENSNSINWFEIPVLDIEKAKNFYETIFSIKMEPYPEMMGMQMIGFPIQMGTGKVGGALVQSKMHQPSQDGVIIYLNGNPDLQAILDRVPSAGGAIAVPKTQISPEIGYMAFFIDTEGNKIALHSQK